MKLKVVWKKSEDPEDYLEVIPYEDNLDEVCENGEATEILTENIIDYLKADEVGDFINKCISKLRHGGFLTLDGTDFSEIVRLYYNAAIDLAKTNLLLFGEGNKKSISSGYELSEALTDVGLTVDKCRYENGRYLIKAVRP